MPGIEAGGHGAFDLKIEVDSFYSLESGLTQQHPDWSKDQVRSQALVTFNTRMFPKQVGSYLAEKRGDKQISPDQVYDVVDGKLVHPDYGAFDKMIDNAQTPEEKESLRLFQETMVAVNPGTTIISVDLHAEGDYGHAVRYLDVATKDTAGRVKLEKRIDIAPEKSKNLRETWGILRELAAEKNNRLITSKAFTQVGVLVLSPEGKSFDYLSQRLQPDRYREVQPQLTPVSAKEKPSTYQPLKTIVYETSEAGSRVVRDAGDVIRSVQHRIKETAFKRHLDEHKRSQKKSFLNKLGERVFDQRQDERVASVLPLSVTATKEKKRQSPTTVVPRKEQSSPILGKEKKILRQFIHRRRQEVRGLQKTITLAVKSGVGIGVAVWGVEFMSKEVVRRQRQFLKDVKRRRQEKRLKPESVRRRKEYWLGKIRRAKEVAVLIRPTPSREKLLARSEPKSFRTVDKKERQRERALRRSIRRWRRRGVDSDPPRAAVQEDIKKLPLTKSKESLAPRVAKKERLARKKKTILTLRIAWNWWLLLSERSRFRRPQIPLSSSERSKSPPVTRLEAKTWLMLSIIWYLVMLREQGKGQMPKKRSKTSVQKVALPSSPILPVQGVIFALGS